MYFLTSIHVPFPGYGSCLGGLPSNWIFFFPAVIQASDVGKEICFSLDIGRKTVEVTLG